MRGTFYQRLKASWQANNSLLCVGLDPDPGKLPSHIAAAEAPLFAFNRAIIDATKDIVCCYKPQIAYYSALSAEDQLEQTIAYIRTSAPKVPVILDAKRNDIGNTSRLYAREAFDRYNVDAVTVSPYMGGDTMTPFFEYRDRGVIILCRTSNPGAVDIQDLTGSDGRKVYQRVAELAVSKWNTNSNVLLVVGATYPAELAEVRAIVGDMPLLVPGIGAQGGDLEAAVKAGRTADGTGLVINVSRSVLYAGSGESFADAARAAADGLRDEINKYRD